MDLRIYHTTPEVSEYLESVSGHVMSEGALSGTPAKGMEVLSAKVVKFLLTIKGTDALNPDYGCYIADFRSGLAQDLNRFKMEALQGVEACAAYIKKHETDQTEPRLRSLELERVKYDRKTSLGRVDLFIRITTTNGDQAVLDVPSGE